MKKKYLGLFSTFFIAALLEIPTSSSGLTEGNIRASQTHSRYITSREFDPCSMFVTSEKLVRIVLPWKCSETMWSSNYCEFKGIFCKKGIITNIVVTDYRLPLVTLGDEICQVGTMVRLDLSRNQMGGRIPTCLGLLKNLEYIDLSGNYITGSIPEQLGELSALKVLKLNDNLLSGSVPERILKLSKLRSLRIQNNKLLQASQSQKNIYSEILSQRAISLSNFIRIDEAGAGSQNRSLCDFARTTNIGKVLSTKRHSQWNCSHNNTVPISNPCFWYGIQCTNSVVTSIILESANIAGVIPSTIGALTGLHTLDLSFNSLSGSIPSEIGHMTALRSLFLLYNRLTSSIPSTLWLLTNLQWLDLDTNSLTGTLSSNIGSLQNLVYLDLDTCPLHGTLPSSIGLLSSLQYLVLYNMGLSGGLPPSISRLTSLLYIDVGGNKLNSSIPSTIGTMTNLQTLSLHGNMFTGPLPSSIGYLANLTQLSFDSNSLTSSIPSSIGYLTQIPGLSLTRNFMTSSLPTALGLLNQLTFLEVYDNSFTGSIPSTLGFLTNIRNLILSASFTSSLPSSIGQLHQLTGLFLPGNAFTTAIPSSLQYLTQLTYMDMSDNQFSSSIPSWIGLLSQLQTLYLHINKFTGSIPSQMGLLSALTALQLQSCSFSSSLPPSLGLLAKLKRFWAYSNRFSSSIPTTVGRMVSLNTLSLSDNRLTGPIPSSIGYLSSSLLFVYLDHNFLSSSLPTALGLLSNLIEIDLSSNRLVGVVPTSVSRMASLFQLHLNANRLTGIPPFQLCNLSNLQFLYMANNSLECALWCQQDGPWGSGYSIPRCPDGQDMAMADINQRLGVARALSKTVSSTTLTPIVTVGSGVTPTLVQFLNAFEYRVTTTLLNVAAFSVVLCADPSCTNILYSNSGGKAFKTSLARPSFYIGIWSGRNGLFILPVSYLFHIEVYHFSTSTWRFGVPQLPGYGNMTYATGLCQEVWDGVTCRLGQVVGLNLKALGLQGPLPTSIGLLTGLSSLVLSSNGIRGLMPSTLGLLTNIVTLQLTSNEFNGTIPTALAMLSTSLVSLDVSYNLLSHSLPTLITSLSKLRVLYADGNLFSGEVSSELCRAVTTKNLTLTLTDNPHLTCYQRECWSTASVVEKQFDSSLSMCVPTQVPTSAPTASPSLIYASTEEDKTSLGTSSIIAIAVLGSMLVVLILGFLVHSFFFKGKVRAARLRKLKLEKLPVHRALLTAGMDIQDIIEAIRAHGKTANEQDYDGDTALKIIYSGKKPYTQLTPEVIAMLIEIALPLDTVTKEPLDPMEHKYGWAESLHQNEEYVIDAVAMTLNKHSNCAQELANSLDEEGRRCIDIANQRCKDIILRKLWLHSRYDLKPGLPEHRSATSVVVFAVDHIPTAHVHGSLQKSYCTQVALKFMLNREQYRRELHVRASSKFDDRYVLGVLSHYDGSSFESDDQKFRSDAIAKGFEGYPFCVVMEAGSVSLKHYIDRENFVGVEWGKIRDVSKQVVMALQHVHRRGSIHGDLKGK